MSHILEQIWDFLVPSEKNNHRSGFLQSKAMLACAILLLVLKIFSVGVFVNFPRNIFFADITRTALLNFANQTRQSLGLGTLAENPKLDLAAQMKAQDMVQNQYFNHTSPSGVSPWHWFSKAGYSYKYAGENLAIGFFDSKEVFDAWMNSPSHKANLVNPNYKEVGTAVLNGFGGSDTIVVVQVFGTAASAPKAVAAQPKNNTPTTKPVVKTTTAPAEKPLVINTEPATVLAESTTQPASGDNYSKAVNFVVYNYSEGIQDIIFGVMMIVSGILLSAIFLSSNLHLKREFVARALVLLVILGTSALISRETLMAILPHSITI